MIATIDRTRTLLWTTIIKYLYLDQHALTINGDRIIQAWGSSSKIYNLDPACVSG